MLTVVNIIICCKTLYHIVHYSVINNIFCTVYCTFIQRACWEIYCYLHVFDMCSFWSTWQLHLEAFYQRSMRSYCSVNVVGNLALDRHHPNPASCHQLNVQKRWLSPRSLLLREKVLEEGHLRLLHSAVSISDKLWNTNLITRCSVCFVSVPAV